MYKSPITIITGQIKYEIENEIYRAVQEVGVSVDKEELIKALQYDREQYIKGYTDGIKKFAHQLKILLEAKAKLYSLSDKDCEFAIVQSTALKTVDNLVKEMVGETE
jgi:hypothetical protein